MSHPIAAAAACYETSEENCDFCGGVFVPEVDENLVSFGDNRALLEVARVERDADVEEYVDRDKVNYRKLVSLVDELRLERYVERDDDRETGKEQQADEVPEDFEDR